MLLKFADEGRFGSLSNSLKEGTFLDQDEYPTTVATMYELMTKHSGAISGQTDRLSNVTARTMSTSE